MSTQSVWRRPRAPRLFAVVLGGGGTLGAFQVGVIDVLARARFSPDLVVGTSVGALNGAFWATHPERNVGRELLELWRTAARVGVFGGRRLDLLAGLLRQRDNLLEVGGLVRVVKSAVPDGASIEDARLPLTLVAMDAETGERVSLRRGPLVPALLASCAIPGVFPAVRHAGRVLVDGGVVANCDLEAAVEGGATDVLVVDLMSEGSGDQRLAAPWPMMAHSVRHSLRRQTDLVIRLLQPSLRIALIRPPRSALTRLGDFSRTAELFALGQDAGVRFLAEHVSRRSEVRPGVVQLPTAS